jgi:hypothetical protein
MKYLCLVYGEEKDMAAMTDDACMAYDQALRNAGRCLASEALQPVHTAATVRVRDGKVSVRDGPFTETKEHLAGFYLIDASDLNDAIQVASRIPPARVGSIEVRPVRELMNTNGERRQL